MHKNQFEQKKKDLCVKCVCLCLNGWSNEDSRYEIDKHFHLVKTKKNNENEHRSMLFTHKF